MPSTSPGGSAAGHARGGPHPTARSALPKHLVVTGYVLDGPRRRVLLLFHRKLKMWLPPGGHVEPNEDPVRALVREMEEETGLRVAVVAPRPAGGEPGVWLLPTPHHLQVERIDGLHEHVDLVYRCRVLGGRLRSNDESEGLRWFTRKELSTYPISHNVRHHALAMMTEGPGEKPRRPYRAARGPRRSA